MFLSNSSNAEAYCCLQVWVLILPYFLSSKYVSAQKFNFPFLFVLDLCDFSTGDYIKCGDKIAAEQSEMSMAG